MYDSQTGVTQRVSTALAGGEANEFSGLSAISIDGQYISFISYASNLVSGDDNEMPDVFRRDVVAGTTTRVSVGAQGVRVRRGGRVSRRYLEGRRLRFWHFGVESIFPSKTR